MDTLISSQQIFGASLQCATIGSRTVSSFPAGALGDGSPAFVLVADAIEELPTRAEGTEVAPVAGMPTVTFADDVDEDEIAAYVASGEPLLVAGAFTVDSLGGAFIERVEGDPSTVVGMSLSTIRRLVRELGGSWTALWNRS